MVTPFAKSAAALLFATPVALLSACAPPGQVPATTPGTTPAIWTGSPAPSTAGMAAGEQEHATVETEAAELDIPVLNAAGQQVATATFEFSEENATVTVKTSGPGKLTPGHHGVHIHAVGKCEAASVSPEGGPAGDFLSAGGHLETPGHAHGEGMGAELPPLEVMPDGSGEMVGTTDLTEDQLTSGQKTAIVIHEADEIAAAQPDGDVAAKRVACGVISAD